MPKIAASWFVNLGEIRLVKLLHQSNASFESYLFNDLLRNESEYLVNTFSKAIRIEPESTTALWGFINSSIASGDIKTAAKILDTLSFDEICKNPSHCIQALIVYSRVNEPDKVINLYQQNITFNPIPWLNEVIALAYLQKGTSEDLMKAYQFHQGDLFASYQLWQRALMDVNSSTANIYYKSLVDFSIQAINPSEKRLFNYLKEVIPTLMEIGIWDRQKTLLVISFLVWKHYPDMNVEQLLQNLSEKYPNEADWLFYLAEVYHRRGDLAKAEAIYRQVIDKDPLYSQVYLRIGMVEEEECNLLTANTECFSPVVNWYQKYYNLLPDDLLGLKKLTEISEVLSRPEAKILRERLDAQLNDKKILEQINPISSNTQELGTNLAVNSSFEDWDGGVPGGWIIADFSTGTIWNKGLCFSGRDDFAGIAGISARVTCFWFEQQSDKEPGRYGLWQWYQDLHNQHETEIRFKPNRDYLVGLTYRTRYLADGKPRFMLSSLLGQQGMLPDTHDTWRGFTTICNSKESDTDLIRPLLTIWSPGEFWFDEVEIREIENNDNLYLK